jgi:acyl-coenzyme A synthetase/AMP-(fatty) acid ligase
MRGYWNRPAETARYLRDGEIAGEKVLHTGDEFCTDDEGFLYFVGRTDDVFKCRGEKVSPVEVERVLCEIPEVAQAAVVGVPDEIDGTAVKAVVAPVADGSLDGTRITRHCRARLESHLVPKFVEIRPALPETAHGKIDKAKLA